MMKKALTRLLTLTIAASLTACGGMNGEAPTSSAVLESPDRGAQTSMEASALPEETPDASAEPGADGAGDSILIAYFTVPETDGVDTVARASRIATEEGVEGSTEFIARAIQSAVGGELFAIETVDGYPGTHDALLDYAYEEQRSGSRPALKTEPEDLSEYNVIFLGYPNWNADLPAPVYTFLEYYDLSGKTIIPFVTHGGSGFSHTISIIQSLQPDAEVLTDGLSVSRDAVAGSAQEAIAWAADRLN